jgi:nitrogen regulatory protein PII
MEFYKAKKVVIVTESAILDDILELLAQLGVTGYTVQRAIGGKGQRGERFGQDFDFSGMLTNVRVEVITKDELARKIALQVKERFFKNFAGIIYLQEGEVVQPEKFNLT